jgi:hypothetical protein
MTTHEPVRERVARVPLLLIVLFSVTTVPGFRPDQAFHTWYDGWLQGAASVALALVAVSRPLACRPIDLLQALLALAVWSRRSVSCSTSATTGSRSPAVPVRRRRDAPVGT